MEPGLDTAPGAFDRARGLFVALGVRARQRPWAAAWLFTALAFAAFFAAWTPIFQVPDDAFIMFTLDGTFYGEPDYRSFFVNTLLTRGIAWLYQRLPGVSWYGFALYGVHFVAAAVWLSLLLRYRRSALEIVLFVFVLSVTTLPMMLELTFSSAALALGSMGIYLHFERSGEPAASLGVPLLAGAMVGIAVLIRDDASPALALPLVPMLLFRARAVPLRRHGAAVAVLLALVLGGRCSDGAAYESPDWQRFEQHFALADAIMRSPSLETSPDLDRLTEEAGWSANDLSLLTSFVYADPDVYDLRSLAVVAEGTAGLRGAIHPLRAVRDRVIGDHVVELLVIVLCLAIFLPRMGRRDRWIALSLAACFLGGAVVLATFIRFPTRIALPMTWMVVSWIVVAAHDERALFGFISNPRVRRGLARTLALILLAVPVVELVSKSRELDDDRVEFLASLEKLARVAPRPVIIAFGELPFENVSPMTTKADLPAFDYVGVGWRQQSPSYNAHMERLGIENVYLAPLEREDVFLVMREDVYPLYAEFVREHYGRQAPLEPRVRINKRVLAYGSPP